MDNDGLSIIVAAHDAELEKLRKVIDVQAEMIHTLAEGVEQLATAVAEHTTITEQIHNRVQKHENTLNTIHRALHRTTDPTN